MDANRISVARLLEQGIAVTWQEAVAITHEVLVVSVVNARLTGHVCRITPETCFLTRRGDVELPARADPGWVDSPQDLLATLLAGREAPPELEAIANGPPSSHLRDDLAPYSRPNRRAEIAALAQRGLNTGVTVATGDAPLDLTVPRESTPFQPAPRPTGEGQSPGDPVSQLRAEVRLESERLGRRRPTAVDWRLSLGVAALVVVGAGSWRWWHAARSDAAETAPSATALPDETTAAVAREATPVPESITDTIPVPVAAPSDRAPVPEAVANAVSMPVAVAREPTVVTRAAPAPAASSLPAGRALRPSSTRPAAPPAHEPAAVPDAPLPVVDSPAPPAAAPNVAVPLPRVPEAVDGSATSIGAVDAFSEATVYSWTTPGVTPPVMVAPRMPRSSFPEASETIIGPYLEVLIDEAGGVEAVRLRGKIAPGETAYRQRMLLAAAKTWQFRPALRGGRPVRYVVRMVIAEDK